MSSHIPPQDVSSREDELHLRDYWRVLVKRRAFIACIVGIVVFGTIFLSLLQLNIYKSSATLMPLAQSRSSLQLPGGLAGLFGTQTQDSPMVRLLTIVQSRTLTEEVIQQMGLIPILFAKMWDADKQQWLDDEPPTLADAVKELKELVGVATDDLGAKITISSTYADPVLAAAITNQYIGVLQRTLSENSFTLAKKHRVFLDEQLQKTRKDLAAAEEALRRFEQKTKIVALDAQTKAAVEAVASLEGQVIAKEVRLDVLKRLMTGANQEVYLLREELQALRNQLTRLQQGVQVPLSVSEAPQRSHMLFSLDEAPDIKLRYARVQREVLIQNKLFALLAEQLEQAKIEEAKDETAFQIVDRAIPPEEKTAPSRAKGAMLAMVASTFLAVFFVFFFEYLNTTVRTGEQITRQIGIALLAAIPPVAPPLRRRQRCRRRASEAVSLLPQHRETPTIEAFRYLYMRLKSFGSNDSAQQTILFTSAEPNENVAFAIVNLAIIAANMGERVLLIDSNVRQPTLHSLLHCPLSPGLAESLTSIEEWQKSIQSTSVDNLYLMASGATLPMAFAVSESPVFGTLLAMCKEKYDLILCSAASVLTHTDAAALGNKVDATCLVLTYGVSRIETATEARFALEAVKVNVIGSILTDFQG